MTKRPTNELSGQRKRNSRELADKEREREKEDERSSKRKKRLFCISLVRQIRFMLLLRTKMRERY